MASLYAEGVTVSEIATQFNLSISAVYNNIKSLPNYQSVKDQRQKNRAERLCEVCGGKHKARGLCVRCYDKWYWRNKNPRNKHLNNA